MQTNQEIFTQVYTHMLKDRTFSWNRKNGGGAYRGAKGKKCAIGCLIPDEFYVPGMERCLDAKSLLSRFPFLTPFLGDNLELLNSLQHIHDCVNPKFWESELQIIAERYKLKCFFVN